MSAPTYRFDIAFSFAGTHRERVRAIAGIVRERLGPDVVFYDEWFEDELNGDDADVFLQNCYEKRSLMVIADVSEDYSGRRWPQAEARAIRALRMTIDTARDEVSRLRLAYIRFAEGDVPGVHGTAITWDAAKKSDEELAALILSRLQKLKEGMAIPVSTPGPLVRASLFQLPPVKADFTGRKTDLDALRGLASGDGGAAAVITGLGGMGGIGKSELAKVLAHEWRPRFPDAQIWLDGYGTRTDPPPPSAGDLIAQVIRAFHPEAGQLPEELATLQTLYRQTLEGKRALIVLDNASDATQAGPLVPPEGCGFIVTSRRSFLVGGKPPHLVGRLPEREAIDLLREICPALAETDAARVAAHCGGLPLALRLSGAHFALDGASSDAVAAYLGVLAGGRLATLDADAADAGEVTIQETLRLSVDPLPAAERAAWLRLGVFAGDFDAEAAQAVAGEVADPAFLNQLVRRNLLERVEAAGGGERYRLHDLAAEYARDRLVKEEGTDACEAAHLTHAKHYAAVGEVADRLYLNGDARAGLALFDRERDQIEAAFAWLSCHSDSLKSDRTLISLVGGVIDTSGLRFHRRQSIVWFEALRVAARRIGDRCIEAAAICNLGRSFGDVGEIHRAIGYFEEALQIAREIGDRDGEGTILGNLGTEHRRLGDAGRAIEYFDQCLEITRQVLDRRGECTVLGNLGIAHLTLGDTSRALACLSRQLELAREIRDRYGEGNCLGNLGLLHINLSDYQRAFELWEQQLEIVREIGDQRGEANALWNLTLSRDNLGERAEALARAEAALAIYEAIEDPNAAMVRKTIAKWRGE